MALRLARLSSVGAAASSRLSLASRAWFMRALSTREAGGGGRALSHEERFDQQEEEAQERFLRRFDGPTPSLRKPPSPPSDAVLESWAPEALVSEEDHRLNVLNFRTQFFHSSADHWDPPESAKVVLRVKVAKLGLSREERLRLVAVCGPVRYNRATGVLKLTSSKHLEPHKNKAELRQTLAALIEDAKQNASAFAKADDSLKPLVDRSDPWLRKRKSTSGRMVARPPPPLINDWQEIVRKPAPKRRSAPNSFSTCIRCGATGHVEADCSAGREENASPGEQAR